MFKAPTFKPPMFKPWLLRIHRWTTLVFAIPFAVLIVTGLILSFEPLAHGSAKSPLTADSLTAVLAKHDPDGKARAITVRAYAGTVSIGGRGAQTHVDLASNEQVTSPGTLANLFGGARSLHEHFVFDLEWAITAATIAMLAMIALGLLMGWPRLRNSLAGWHKGTAWILLPLLILSPLTGLMLAYGVSFSSPPPRAPSGGPPVALADAIRIVGASHDLARINWIRPLGGRLAARVNDGGEFRVFAVTRDGLVPFNRNWPRLLHEGNWSGLLAPGINVVISAALMLLLTTGLWMWGRRRFRLM